MKSLKEHAINLWQSHLSKHASQGNNLAHLMLKNGYTGAIGKYADYSMSNSAVNAYKNGSMPLSQWNSNHAKELSKILGKKISVKELKDFLSAYGKDGYHHTSKYYNKTNFYSLPKAFHGIEEGKIDLNDLRYALEHFT